MEVTMNNVVRFIKIKESRYNELKENGELIDGFYLIEKDDQEGKKEDELVERQY